MGPRSPTQRGAGRSPRESAVSSPRTSLGAPFRQAADALVLVDRHGVVREVAGTAVELFGRSGEALEGESLDALCLPAARSRLKKNLERALHGDRLLFSTQVVGREGVVVPVEVSVQAVHDPEPLLVCIIRDTTGRALGFPLERLELENEIRKLQLQLQQSQRMEAVGLMGSGMAHDFNNLLNVVLGYAELLARSLPEADTRRARIDQILQATLKAGALTRRLLAFSRKPVQQPQVIDTNAFLAETECMLHRLIGENVALTLELGEDVGNVKVDPGQLEQVLLNLAVNARHAMPRGGTLTLATDGARPRGGAEPAPSHRGEYVRLTVTDTGVGMDDKTQALIFEPFFTTKPRGEGTGLGLATVSGIVRQSGGVIEVESEPGHGTSFRIYLPRVDEEPTPLILAPPSQPGPRGHETILLVEDQDALRDMIREALELLGYRVLAAPDGEAALDVARRDRGGLDLLVTDLVMPRMDGADLAQRLSALRPGLKVLYMSGHGPEVAVRHGLQVSGAVLEKPFSTKALSLRVREVLDRPSGAEA